jgi:hypothetical protein
MVHYIYAGYFIMFSKEKKLIIWMIDISQLDFLLYDII